MLYKTTNTRWWNFKPYENLIKIILIEHINFLIVCWSFITAISWCRVAMKPEKKKNQTQSGPIPPRTSHIVGVSAQGLPLCPFEWIMKWWRQFLYLCVSETVSKETCTCFGVLLSLAISNKPVCVLVNTFSLSRTRNCDCQI